MRRGGRRSVFRTPPDDTPSCPRASSRCRGAFPPSSSSPSPYRYPARDPVEQHVDDLPERDDARSEGCVLGHHHHIVVNMMMGGGRGRDAGGEGGRGTTTLMAVWSIAIVM
jgi:hypothetical protein